MTEPVYQPDLQTLPLEPINTEGVREVGELNTRLMREAQVAEDYANAIAAGATGALTETAKWILARIGAAGPFDDTRALRDLSVWLADKIREVNAKESHATP